MAGAGYRVGSALGFATRLAAAGLLAGRGLLAGHGGAATAAALVFALVAVLGGGSGGRGGLTFRGLGGSLLRGRALLAAAARLGTAVLVQLHELVFLAAHLRHGLAAGEHGVRHAHGVELHGADGVVVARDHVINAVGRVIGVHHADDGDVELAGLADRDLLVAHVDDKQGVRQAVHLLDAAQALLQLLHLATQADDFLLAEALKSAVSGLGLQFLHAADGLAHGLVVGEGAAQPALVHAGHAAAARLLADGLAGGTLGADEQDGAAVGDEAFHELGGLVVHRQRLLEVDDVDAAALAEDERRHLRVPETGLMTEMHASFEHLAHGHGGRGHYSTPAVRNPLQAGKVPGVRPPYAPCRDPVGFVSLRAPHERL